MNEDKFETMELAVKEQSDELVKINQQLRDLFTTVNLLRNVVSDFQEKLNSQNITVNADTQPIQEMIDGALLNMSLMIEKALAKMRSNFWQLYFQLNGPKWTVILVVVITFLILFYKISLHWLEM